MQALETDIVPVAPPQAAQPSDFPKPGPSLLDQESVIREALNAAEARGEDPSTLRVGEVLKGPESVVEPEVKPSVPEVPEKFRTPTGEVDVEKLKASDKALDAAMQKKETETQKTVDELFASYLEKEKKFRAMPNPEKLAEVPVPVPETTVQPQSLPLDQLKAKILADLNSDPVGAITELIDIIAEQKIRPVKSDIEQSREERKHNAIKANLKTLAEKDPRVLNPTVFAAINAKLDSDPDLWKLKNPHKAAFLEVKDEMRLGEWDSTPVAQPSKAASPILGGGTPPPPQSNTAGVINSASLAASLKQVNLKDSNQFNSVEKAFKDYMDKEFRAGR